jgi:hypothetical protein
MNFPVSRNRLSAIAGSIYLLIVLFPCLAHADVVLQWDPNSETDLAGYKVYYGTSSGIYGTPITIGTQASYTFTQLASGTYYFAVTAYNASGLESAFSNEVIATVGATGAGCDINGDSHVDVLDLQILSNVVLLIRTCPGSCDRNGDGRVDVLDVQVLANVILGLRSCP